MNLAIGSISSTPSTMPATGLDPTSAAKPHDPVAEAAERVKANAQKQAEELREIREKGIYQYAREKKFEALKARIEAELRASSTGELSEADFAAELARRVQEAIKDATTSEARKAAEEGRLPKPMIVDISV